MEVLGIGLIHSCAWFYFQLWDDLGTKLNKLNNKNSTLNVQTGPEKGGVREFAWNNSGLKI